ncbi:hypothetical protein PQR67_13500 [Paraburkholderia fungorum]|uniref:hypothetical protein n=1 Tax=Paraburkholderia fungorum TaxID=134537 RepID=UPI0038BA79C0
METIDDIENKHCAVVVDHDGLEKCLLSSVPAYGGGKYSYCDQAEVSGIVKEIGGSDFPRVIGQIRKLTIYKYGGPMSVML